MPEPDNRAVSQMILARVDFDAKKIITIRKYENFSDSEPSVMDDSTGTLYAIVGHPAGPPTAVAINVATGDYKDLPQPKIDRIHGMNTWVSSGWNAALGVVSILTRNDSYMVNNQRNFSVISWNPSTGDLGKGLPPFLFPPPLQFFGKIDTIATFFDTKELKHYMAITDRSDTVGIVEVDATTGQPTNFGEFDHEVEPRQLVTLH